MAKATKRKAKGKSTRGKAAAKGARRKVAARKSAAKAKKTGKYVPADRVIGKLARKLVRAKQRAA